jgi:hypothetical protein
MKGEDNVELSKPKFDGAATPLLEKMEPRFGSVVGGETVKFSGKSFSSDASKYEILIDGVACAATAATADYVQCTLGKRPGLPKP